jgi:hypothetical protein
MAACTALASLRAAEGASNFFFSTEETVQIQQQAIQSRNEFL